jgi:very-short-patch-repair endonuclease
MSDESRTDRRALHKTERARELRRDATLAERRMWKLVRGKVLGVRFRRQQPIGPFIVDFYCPAARLAVEIDGMQHEDETITAYDERRTRWLSARGIRLLRFSNGIVWHDVESVVKELRSALDNAASTKPPVRVKGRVVHTASPTSACRRSSDCSRRSSCACSRARQGEAG